eukprot:c14925_g2_i1 orf=189-386(-)
MRQTCFSHGFDTSSVISPLEFYQTKKFLCIPPRDPPHQPLPLPYKSSCSSFSSVPQALMAGATGR